MLAVAGLMLTLALTFAGAHAQSAAAPQAGAAVKTAGEQFKNVQVLKDLPADQLLPAMNFITVALGVECEECHVRGANEKDDKQPKLAARHMMQMQMDINKNNFNGNRQVTCYTCHRGSENPVGVPAILETEGERARPAPAAAAPATPPTADQLLAKYIDAIGGAAAVSKITTRVEKGNTILGENKTPIDLYMKAPNMRYSVTHGTNGDSITAFDGTAGWQGGGRGGPRSMAPIDSMSAMVDAALAFPTNIKSLFPQMRVRTDKIGDKEYYMIAGRGPGTPSQVRMYFDEQTGLLTRVIRYNDAGLGVMPVQVDYSDYRDADGIKIPFRWTLSRPNGRFTIQVDSVQQNVPVDDSKFAKPAAPPPAQ
jgi:photosynthetic reaction center cytochrome c subunit|nr:c-type cytochrome [Candidatus Acidoferrales bacterium]